MRKIKKIVKWGLITTGIISILAIAGLAFLFIFYQPSTEVDRLYITSEMMQEEINKHRRDKGLTELEPTQVLCDEISTRAQTIRKNHEGDMAGHEGFDEWKNKVAPGWDVGEIIFTSQGSLLPEAVVYGWEQSPSHKIILEKPELTHICTYVLNAEYDEKGKITKSQIVVAELGRKIY